MPELPEVETVCRGLDRVLRGHRIIRLELRRADMRFPFPANLPRLVEGRCVAAVERRAKFILIRLEDGGVVIAHLGMSGRMLARPAEETLPAKHDHAVFTIDDGTMVSFHDPRRFGLLDYTSAANLTRHRLLQDLGPEPLDPGFTGAVLAQRLAGRHVPIKAALLDQKIVAGLGNIYVCESLFAAGLSPRRLAFTVTGARADRLAAAIRDVLSRAVAAGGSSLRDYVQATGELGYFQHQWAVYGREGERCPDCRCDGGIRRIVQAGRSTFHCSIKQR